MQNNILIKASGDVVDNTKFQQFCKDQATKTQGQIVIICGSGKQINSNLQKRWYSIHYNDTGERIISCDIQEQIVRDTLKATTGHVEQIFKWYSNISVQWSWLEIAGVYCHINADTLVITYYLGFQDIYVFTFPWNKENKQKHFAKYPKVQIIEL